MDGSIFIVAARTRPCSECWRLTWQESGVCRLCQKGAVTPS